MANSLITTESKETIEQILKFHECDDTIKVQQIKLSPGSREGDNYMSVVKRLTVCGSSSDQNHNKNGKYIFLLF